jgi:hypothetical protein
MRYKHRDHTIQLLLFSVVCSLLFLGLNYRLIRNRVSFLI